MGDVFGSALAAEGIFAFFLESGFLAVLLFGWDRVGPRVHFLATCMVAFGAHFSAIWIVVANSWMQTPAGFHIVGAGTGGPGGDHRFLGDGVQPVLDGPAQPHARRRLAGRGVADGQRRRLVSAAPPSSRLRARLGEDRTRTGRRCSGILAGHRPRKRAREWRATSRPNWRRSKACGRPTPQAPLHLVGWVDEKNERDPWSGHLRAAELAGPRRRRAAGDRIERVPRDARPPVNFGFQLFHLMVIVGFAMIGLALWAAFDLWRGRLERSRLLLWLLTFSVLGPQIANQAGWWAAEVGRQPWIVYNLLRTSAALSAVVTANQVAASMVMFMVVYLLLFAVFLFLLNNKIQHGPDEGDLQPAGKWALGFASKGGAA